WEGFQWIDADNANESILSYRRIAKNGDELIFVLNLTPIGRERFNLGVPQKGVYAEIFNSDEERFGGTGVANGRVSSFECNGYREHGQENAIELRLPPLSAVVLKRESKKNASK
ncbi:MAG: alpha amylase C-terminal domain-containing protein, partial [Clostridia bacterium]|nr:alpha amylase C-terminal domain-containing protein [Clostridia bacterium]